MNNFKTIRAIFNVYDPISNKAFKKGSIITIERHITNCNKSYGDMSGHMFKCDTPTIERWFDTRYDGIRPIKIEWVIFWENWFLIEYGIKIELKEYKEEWVNVNEEE